MDDDAAQHTSTHANEANRKTFTSNLGGVLIKCVSYARITYYNHHCAEKKWRFNRKTRESNYTAIGWRNINAIYALGGLLLTITGRPSN